MAQLRDNYEAFVDRDTEIIAVGPENLKDFSAWWEEHDMPFTGIPDPEHIIARQFGQQVKLLKLGRMPAEFLLDKQGYIRFQHRGDSMKDIPEISMILHLIDDLS